MAIPALLTAFASLTLAFPVDGRAEGNASVTAAEVVEARVVAENLEVFDQPKDAGYVVAGLKRGDRVRIRWKEPAPAGWLAIEPPPTVVCWIEEAAVERPEDAGPADHVGVSTRTRVRTAHAVVRSGNPEARLPGPPCQTLERGEPVLLVDRPALTFGGGRGRRWLAIAPSSNQSFFAAADGIGWDRPTSPAAPPPVDAVRAGYQPAADSESAVDPELRRIDGMLQAIVTGQPVENWKLADVRAEYQTLLKSRPALEESLRSRLAQVTRYEQAAKSAQRIIAIVSKSRRRDEEVAKVERKMVTSAQESRRLFDAVGFVQPSSRMVNGHKVYALIGREGTAVAYLDIPPGLDPEPLLAHRVGVRGHSRFNGELGTRVIAVSDLENLEPKR
ncbi:MAG: hypothetical protein P4L85_08715 [Paludisphaera borealis]|uniref:hypothetical protein n=1 Tax=Paludisphaera borealis TaxID=1387353 RepID=UPI0028416D90|nr:hypothetical protein [Paludisphaera borealis]MDR3619418.1 hypothetical protein [Paludisphaera borealis]